MADSLRIQAWHYHRSVTKTLLVIAFHDNFLNNEARNPTSRHGAHGGVVIETVRARNYLSLLNARGWSRTEMVKRDHLARPIRRGDIKYGPTQRSTVEPTYVTHRTPPNFSSFTCLHPNLPRNERPVELARSGQESSWAHRRENKTHDLCVCRTGASIVCVQETASLPRDANLDKSMESSTKA